MGGAMTKVAVLGSTGSIGCNTLRVVDSLGEGFKVTALGAGRSVERLTEPGLAHRPEVVSVAGPAEADALARLLADRATDARPEILHGTEGLVAVAAESGADTVVSAAVGSLGLVPIYRALERGLRV